MEKSFKISPLQEKGSGTYCISDSPFRGEITSAELDLSEGINILGSCRITCLIPHSCLDGLLLRGENPENQNDHFFIYKMVVAR